MFCLTEKINHVALCLPFPDGLSSFCDKRGCLAQIVILRHDNTIVFTINFAAVARTCLSLDDAFAEP